MINNRVLIILLIVLVCKGCNLATDFQRPELSAVEQWRAADTMPVASAIEPQWWQVFGSISLNQLITQALQFNNDLAAARHRVEQARAQAKIAGSWLWPSVEANAGFDDRRNEKVDTQVFSGGLDVAYEVDLWGSNRAKRDAGAARLLSETFSRDALQLVVMADVGQSYFDLLALSERKRIAQDFLDNVSRVLTIVEARYLAGAASAVEVAQQKTELANAQASLDLIVQQRALAENTLSILLGQPPHNVSDQDSFDAIVIPQLMPEQPLSLLERRPDIRQLETELQAAHADITVARAAFYPKLQLSFDALLASPQPAGIALTVASGLVQPLFQGGRLEGELARSEARKAELTEQYRQAFLIALREVEDALAIRTNSSRRLQALALAVDQARQAYELSQQRYQVGAIDYQALLNTQRSYLTAQNSQVQARLDVLLASVQLFKALGGGWRAETLG